MNSEMVFQIERKKTTDEILVNLTTRDVAGRVEHEVLDIIAVRLADKYIQDNGERILHGLVDDDELRREVREIVKKRIINETERQTQNAE